jgi:ubiquinone/menaquinone biosynthesis C-methylase UbiE
MDTEQQVARHYTHGALESALLQALTSAGIDIEKLTPADLAGVDEFHLGWRAATAEIAKDLNLSRAMHVLDVGSGIGGPARHFAEGHGARVTGIDLTQEFVDVANALTVRCKLADLATFQQASALALPFAEHTFDAATLIHVGMNIEDKARLFSEVHRVLGPHARFAVYDVMRTSDGDLPYPMPWAATPATSFVRTPDDYRRMLANAGFKLEGEVSRRDMVLKLRQEMRRKIAEEGPPKLGLHVLMGDDANERIDNVMTTLERGIIAPIEMIVQKG